MIRIGRIFLGRRCTECRGRGWVRVSQLFPDIEETCQACLGTGLRFIQRGIQREAEL